MVISLVIWSIVVISLLETLNYKFQFVIRYADDLAIIIIGKHVSTECEVAQYENKIVEKLCIEHHLGVNPHWPSPVP